MESINAGTATHGVMAGDGGNGGLTLKTTDGRNLSVWYDSTVVSGTDFGLGMDTPTPSNPMGVTGVAGASAISAGSVESSEITFKDMVAGERVTINGLSFTSLGATAKADVAIAFSNLKSGMTAIAATAANSASAAKGTFSGTFAEGFTTGSATAEKVTATAVGKGNVSDISISVTTAPTVVTTQSTLTTKESSVITFNPLAAGEAVTVNGLTYTAKNSLSASQVAAAFASLASGMTAAAATTANSASAALGTYSGTAFTSGFVTGEASGSSITATSVGTGANLADIVVTASITAPTASTTAGISVAASTVYGTVTLTSIEPFTVKPGANAYPQGNAPAADPTYSNFTALGFESQTINPKNIGRLSFQVGPAENQLITIDMADFGPNGDITGPITSLTAPTNLLSMQSANDVIMNVNKSLDRIASTRATMGAVMNRLEHVIDNLTNVVMNSEASRSQIEDADYAQASTELARTQIMQQAATAVLAQANTSQQTVLKLLQG
jgi:flagellin